MFTEDDNKKEEKWNVKKFLHNQIKTDEKKTKNNSKKEEPSDEDYYNDWYDDSKIEDNSQDDVNDNEESHNKKKILIILLLAIIFFILLFVLLFVFNKKDKPDIKLLQEQITLKVEEEKFIGYEIINTNDVLKVEFTSNNNSIATVDENGKVKGIASGETIIILSYNNGKNEKACSVTVVANNNNNNNQNNNNNNNNNNNQSKPVSTTPPTLSLSGSVASGVWSKDNVTITIKASSNAGGSINLSYALNCSSNCQYQTVKNNSITVSSTGVVTVVATDSVNKKQTTKTYDVKVDKTAPTIAIIGYRKEYQSSTPIEICATCKDNESGCQKDKICKIYSTSASDQTLTFYDKSGNIGLSAKFNVVIK